jgi:hypothetical protein
MTQPCSTTPATTVSCPEAFYAVDPLLYDVGEEPRFKAMLKRMSLPK